MEKRNQCRTALRAVLFGTECRTMLFSARTATLLSTLCKSTTACLAFFESWENVMKMSSVIETIA